MTTPNPYQPPAANEEPPAAMPEHPEGWVPCPQCGSTHLEMPSFTWWGGAVGQKLLTHVKCQSCGLGFNGKTGKSNTPAIVIYQVVAFVVVIGLLYAFEIL
ncbi:MAG: hypothetical protein KC457_18070 [Myxococcales bacterium]|nr:hypothetical protein [Myxococcales bacterium]